LWGSRSAATQATALAIAATLEVWDVTMERTVVGFTMHRDPRVRAAAYAALGQRDAGLWACAGIVHESAFDPDPAVQDVARRHAR
jgi:hypothetical protein